MKKRKQVEKRSPQANWAARQREVGNCPICGDPRDFNKRTGKPYGHCEGCRDVIRPQQAALMRKRRAAGKA
jgi:hypothetical protein